MSDIRSSASAPAGVRWKPWRRRTSNGSLAPPLALRLGSVELGLVPTFTPRQTRGSTRFRGHPDDLGSRGDSRCQSHIQRSLRGIRLHLDDASVLQHYTDNRPRPFVADLVCTEIPLENAFPWTRRIVAPNPDSHSSCGEVKRLLDRGLVQRLPTFDPPHGDLPGGHQGSEQHGRPMPRSPHMLLDLNESGP